MGLIPSCLWLLRIFPSLPDPRLTKFYRDANSVLLLLVNQRLDFTHSCSHAFRYGRKNPNSGDNNRTYDFRTSRCAGYLLDHSGDEGLNGVKWQIPVFDGETISWRRFEMEFLMAMRHLHLDSELVGDKEEISVVDRTISTLRQFEGSEKFCCLESDFKLAEDRC